MYSQSDNIEIIINDKADEVIKKTFKSLFSRYQIDLEVSIKAGDFILDYVYLLHHKCHKINPNFGGSYTVSPD